MQMKKLWLGIGLMCCSLSIVAAQKVDKMIEAAPDGYVEIEHLNGVANIKGWDRQEVRVVGTLGDKTEEFIFHRDGNEVVIKIKVKRSHGWGNKDDEGDDLQIFVPNNSKLSYTSVNADVDLAGITGGVDVNTVSGGIEANALSGRIRLESVNGNVRGVKLYGDIKIETVNGDIHSLSSGGEDDKYESVNGDIIITSASKEVRVETVNGDMELTLSLIEHLNVNTVNGSMEVRLKLVQDGQVIASSVGGPVTLVFTDDVSARFDLRGHAGGRIVNELSGDKVQKDQYGPGRWLEFTLNGGNGKVNVSTVSGRVTLSKG
ncbi:MAG: DUF4097 and DUF4098 domain-containing protein YvlB [Paraglaciecola sp.]|jgi:DUF4097 and DUF4098 domain-containing protein YvlB